ncbi:MAG: signal peptidase I, partial [Lachnospiraceae bacterium]|nr:signal peptidase I [Lachnospiraceae bacterium]
MKDKTKRKQKETEEKNQKETTEKKKDNEQDAEEKEQPLDLKKEILEMVLYIIFVFAVVWVTFTYIGNRIVVDGDSMYDTLSDRDNLIVSKISYLLGEPERFDIVIFPVDDEGTYYIKRIIGLPGETIRIDEDGVIYINEKPLQEDYGYETIELNRIGRAREGVTLGDDEYFVMGDNRNNSTDSRTEEVGNIE